MEAAITIVKARKMDDWLKHRYDLDRYNDLPYIELEVDLNEGVLMIPRSFMYITLVKGDYGYDVYVFDVREVVKSKQ